MLFLKEKGINKFFLKVVIVGFVNNRIKFNERYFKFSVKTGNSLLLIHCARIF